MPFFVYDPTEWYLLHVKNAKKVLNSSEIMLPTISNNLYKQFTLVPVGTLLRKMDVIISSSIQPDFGFDMYLYSDSNSSFAQDYNFGTQVLGAPTDFNSQILFHMSTYQDQPIVLNSVPRLKENYPEYRAILYFELSQFASENNHPYWSAVFLGWGLHYIQDITQPYHSVLTAGLNERTIKNSIDALKTGHPKRFQNIISLQTNRHILLENLTNYILTSNDKEIRNYQTIFIKALSNPITHINLIKCQVKPGYLRNDLNVPLAKEAASYAVMLHQALPTEYVNDPSFQAESFNDYTTLFKNQMDLIKRNQFTEQVSNVLIWFGAYTRSCIERYA